MSSDRYISIVNVEPSSAAVSNVRLQGVHVVLGAVIAMGLGFGALSLTSVFMRPLESQFGWTRSETSLAYALATIGMAVGGAVWGRLSDRLDIRVLLGIGGTGMVLSLLTMASVQSLWQFYLANLALGGMGFAALYAPLISASGEWFSQRRGMVTGVVTAGGALGQGVMPFVANLLIEGSGWRIAYAGLGLTTAVILALALPVIRWPSGTRAPAAASSAVNRAVDVSNPSTVPLLAIAAFLCCACMGVPLVHMANYIGTICASPTLGATSLLVAMISGAVGRICFGSVADRIGGLPSYAIASCIQTACVIVYPFLADGASLLILSAVFGFGFAGNMTCLTICVRNSVPLNRFGGAIGIVMLVAWFGMASGGYVGGVLFDVYLNYGVSFALAGAAGILNLVTIAAIGNAVRDRPKVQTRVASLSPA